jgi:L-lactate dehydrogenase complex protein LldG
VVQKESVMSDSRAAILSRIRDLNLEKKEHPVIPDFEKKGDVKSLFIDSLVASHVSVIEGNLDASLFEQITSKKDIIYSNVDELSSLSTIPKAQLDDQLTLSSLDHVIVRGDIGVGENGAIWLPESNIEKRILSFITLHLIVIVSKNDLVHDMHQAYSKIKELPGFGLFVAGPSKTADIEQSLVIGAHGPKRMTVLLID